MVDSKKLQDKARETLVRDDVRRLIGWKRGTYGYEAAPAVIKDASDAETCSSSTPVACRTWLPS